MGVEDRQALDRFGRRGIAVSFAGQLLCLPALFIPAGTWSWANAWVFLGITTSYLVVRDVLLARWSPQLLNERGKFAKEGTPMLDRVFLALYVPLVLAVLVVGGFDFRYGWSNFPPWVLVLGLALLFPALALGIWTMVTNPFFECTIRIQQDREQKVISSGPYHFMRHPGYVSLILATLTYPLILGSWWAFVPAGVLIAGVVLRTALEDRMLRLEMPGYMEYAARPRNRLLPMVL